MAGSLNMYVLKSSNMYVLNSFNMYVSGTASRRNTVHCNSSSQTGIQILCATCCVCVHPTCVREEVVKAST